MGETGNEKTGHGIETGKLIKWERRLSSSLTHLLQKGQKDRQTESHKDRDRVTVTERERQPERKTDRQKSRQAERERDRETDRQRQGERKALHAVWQLDSTPIFAEWVASINHYDMTS